MKKCLKFQKWLEKKGNPTSFVCYESNMVNVNTNTWWIDSGFNFKWWFCLELQKTFYVPSFSRNLISVSRLVPFGYSFHFSETSFSLIYKSDCVGNGILSDGLYCIFLQNGTTHNSVL